VRRLLALALLAALAGCGGSDAPTRLDGAEPQVRGLSVSDAVERPEQTIAFVRGYLQVPVDDVSRLCTALPPEGGCEGPSLVLANRHDDLRRLAAPVLEHGCCARGAWSAHPVVVEVWLMPDRRAHVLG
jgi:hypothetical protein